MLSSTSCAMRLHLRWSAAQPAAYSACVISCPTTWLVRRDPSEARPHAYGTGEILRRARLRSREALSSEEDQTQGKNQSYFPAPKDVPKERANTNGFGAKSSILGQYGCKVR